MGFVFKSPLYAGVRARIVYLTCLVDCKYVVLHALPLPSALTEFPFKSCSTSLNINSTCKALANVKLHNTDNSYHKQAYLSYRTMSRVLRYTIEEADKEGFEEIIWSGPKQ
jgi:hypothetical protein